MYSGTNTNLQQALPFREVPSTLQSSCVWAENIYQYGISAKESTTTN